MPQVVKFLVTNKVNVNAAGRYNGYTPLQFAALNGSLAMTQLLVDAGADIGAENHFGETARDWARARNHHKVLNYLDRRLQAQIKANEDVPMQATAANSTFST